MAEELDREICVCMHVSLRKLLHFARRERPHPASRMSECLGAGTGCGWCIPFLRRIAADPDHFSLASLTPEDYRALRKDYIETSRPRNRF